MLIEDWINQLKLEGRTKESWIGCRASANYFWRIVKARWGVNCVKYREQPKYQKIKNYDEFVKQNSMVVMEILKRHSGINIDKVLEAEKRNYNRASVINQCGFTKRANENKIIEEVIVVPEDAKRLSFDDVSFFVGIMRNKKGRHGEDIKTTAVGSNLSRVHRFLLWCMNKGIVEKSVIPKEFTKRKVKNEPDILSKEECSKLFRGAETPRDKLIVAMLLKTGMRLGDLINLKLSDINYQTKIISIKNGKFGKGRSVPFDEQLKIVVEDWLKVRDLFSPKCDNVLVTQTGRPLNKSTVNETLKDIATKQNIMVNGNGRSFVYPHLLRHTFGTHYIADGGNIVVLQHILGHESLDTTRIYITLAEKFKSEDYQKTVMRL